MSGNNRYEQVTLTTLDERTYEAEWEDDELKEGGRTTIVFS